MLFIFYALWLLSSIGTLVVLGEIVSEERNVPDTELTYGTVAALAIAGMIPFLNVTLAVILIRVYPMHFDVMHRAVTWHTQSIYQPPSNE